METLNDTIPVPTELISRLFKIKQGVKLGAMWGILRYVDDGSGALDIEYAKDRLEFYLDKSVGDMLGCGDGLFWRLTPGGKVLIYSPVRVADNLGLPYPGSHITLIPVSVLKNHTKTKAAFFCSFLNKIDTPISQEKLYEITGCSISSQKRYRKLMKMPFSANIVIIEKNGVPVKYHPQLQKVMSESMNCFPVKRNNQILLGTKIPNNYYRIFSVDYSKRQARGNGRGKKQAGTKFQSRRVFFGNRGEDTNIPEKSAIKFYRKDHTTEHDYQPALFEIFGEDLAPAVRDWVMVLPWDADWTETRITPY